MNKDIKKAITISIIKDNKKFSEQKAYMLGKLAFKIDSSFKAGEVSGEALLNTVKDVLPNQERSVLLLRYNLSLKNSKMQLQSLSAIGDSLGLSHERIRKIELQALKKLRHPANIIRFSLRESDIATKERLSKGDRTLDIDFLCLDSKLTLYLKRAGKNKIADLCDMTYEELLQIRSVGQKGVDEIFERLKPFR